MNNKMSQYHLIGKRATQDDPTLLKTHRILALGQAPLRDRLEVIRALYSGNPEFWCRDLKDYEKAYITELIMLARQAQKGKDLCVLNSVLADVKSSEWILKHPPSDFVKSLEMCVQHIEKNISMSRNRRWAKELTAALEAECEGICRSLVSEGKEFEIGMGRGGCDKEFSKLMNNAIAWLEELERRRGKSDAHEAASIVLDRAIDTLTEGDTLDRPEVSDLSVRSDIPAEVERQQGARRNHLRGDNQSKIKLGSTLVIIGLVLSLAGFVSFTKWRKEAGEKDRWITQFDDALRVRDVTHAGRMLGELEELNPGLLGDVDVAKRINTYKVLLGDERKRRAMFNSVLEELRATCSAIDRGDVNIVLVKKYLEELRRLAVLENEDAIVQAWIKRMELECDIIIR
jgi:hypothetical protein